MSRLTIDPLTRIEGHGRVEIFLDAAGEVSEAYFIGTEFRGFETLCVGRPVEEMPGLTSRICGLCPEAHHMASVKALDALFGVEPTRAVRVIRELLYASFIVSNHGTHFFALAAPDLLLDQNIPPAERNLIGVVRQLGPELGRRIMANRVENQRVVELLGGRRVHPVAGLPGGWSRSLDEVGREWVLEVANRNVAFARDSLQLYREAVLARPDHRNLLRSPGLTHRLHSLATVDAHDQLSFVDGMLRAVDPEGREVARFPPHEYLDHLAERTEPWTYLKLPYLRDPGWQGLRDGVESGTMVVGPLARMNACERLSTPLAEEARIELFTTLGERRPDGRFRPIHFRLATHWARLIEMLHASERMVELASTPELTDPDRRSAVPSRPVCREAVGSVEAPRGTLIHHYRVDDEGLVTGVNLVVATTLNHAALALTVTGAARELIRPGVELSENLLNRIEMAIRAHDPCLACATHSFPGEIPLRVVLRDQVGVPIAMIHR